MPARRRGARLLAENVRLRATLRVRTRQLLVARRLRRQTREKLSAEIDERDGAVRERVVRLLRSGMPSKRMRCPPFFTFECTTRQFRSLLRRGEWQSYIPNRKKANFNLYYRPRSPLRSATPALFRGFDIPCWRVRA